MKIRTRLALFYTLITAGILGVFGSLIYWSATINREQEFYTVLKNEAITKANLLLNAKVAEQTLQKIYISNRSFINEVEVAIYLPPFELLYHDAVDIDIVEETPELIEEVLTEGEVRFQQEKWQVIGIHFEYENVSYVLIAAAYDEYGFNKLAALRGNMLMIFLIGIIVVYSFGIIIAKKAFDPVKQMAEQAKKITAYNLDIRLQPKTSKDELADLSATFNAMLDRLEQSFAAQKDFVSNIAHEIRTPLTAIIGEMELLLDHPKTDKATKKAVVSALEDAKRLSKIANSLMDLAKANYDTANISFKNVRIDEVLLDACHEIQKSNRNYKTELDFLLKEEQDLDVSLTMSANEYLLKIAFINIIENACKYSEDKKCAITIDYDSPYIIVSFKDNGGGISPEDLTQITTPFFRGQSKTKGAGIGLSLTKRILELHNGNMKINSKLNIGTTVIVRL